MPEKLRYLLTSRKFWAAVAAVVVAVMGERAGVDGEALTGAIAILMTYILATALEDGLRGN